VSGEGGGDGGGRGEAWRHGDDEMEEEMRWDRSKRAPSPGELCASIFTASERGHRRVFLSECVNLTTLKSNAILKFHKFKNIC
jgi:hypothetical protein